MGRRSMPTPTRRVVLLGASNVTLSFATIVQTVRRTWDEPVEILAATGHGRSYGQDSWILGRKFSGIFSCALWQDLQERPVLPTTALVTDVGNDLMYGATPERLLEWVARCLDRLTDAGAHVSIRAADWSPRAPVSRVFNSSDALLFDGARSLWRKPWAFSRGPERQPDDAWATREKCR